MPVPEFCCIILSTKFTPMRIVRYCMIHPLPRDMAARIDKLASIRRNEIKNSWTNLVITGTVYYVSRYGSDANDGLSPDTPWQSRGKVDSFAFRPGDAVRPQGNQTGAARFFGNRRRFFFNAEKRFFKQRTVNGVRFNFI